MARRNKLEGQGSKLIREREKWSFSATTATTKDNFTTPK